MPALRTLSITTREGCGFIWPQTDMEGLAAMGFRGLEEPPGGCTPVLETIIISDGVSNPRSGLSFQFLNGWVCGLTKMDTATITLVHAGAASNIDNKKLPWTFTMAGTCGPSPDFPLRHDYSGPLDNYSTF